MDDVPDAELDRLADLRIDWVWFLSVWQTGQARQQVSRTNPQSPALGRTMMASATGRTSSHGGFT
jgi:hypothetical protein